MSLAVLQVSMVEKAEETVQHEGNGSKEKGRGIILQGLRQSSKNSKCKEF